ncbi:MAG: bifunctional oligoribonuclease/PAP phosphatase NrnA [Calditrichaeota bacterium]|nr:MAG: bifunctional oligoribonuclease/PAP phosphatase NrnA [Calditrichota bacterium]
MISKSQIQQIGEVIDKYNQFIITTHVNPDGDGLGSEIALANFLRQKKKAVKIINNSHVPENYLFLDPNSEIELFSKDRHIEAVTSSDVIFILDISDWARLRELGEIVQGLGTKKICIDHHPLREPFADLDIIYPEASSTGELIFELLVGLGAKINQRISEAIYTAILTDTGSFRFTNTSPAAHRIVATLLENGINPQKIYSNVYENQSLAKVRLMARVLNDLQLDYEGKLAWMRITQKMLKQTGATLKDTEGLADYPRSIAGVEVALLFMELEDGRVKISFRSKGNVVINGLAQYFSGGGHAFAAGATTDGPLEEVITRAIEKAGELFRSPAEEVMRGNNPPSVKISPPEYENG